ncbi:hypothetical protein AKJ16_DCAP26656 [Drosera capensis]
MACTTRTWLGIDRAKRFSIAGRHGRVDLARPMRPARSVGAVGSSKRDKGAPKVNWLQHANSFGDFSNQKKFLTSSFLFSLPTQKPPAAETVETR